MLFLCFPVIVGRLCPPVSGQQSLKGRDEIPGDFGNVEGSRHNHPGGTSIETLFFEFDGVSDQDRE